MYVPALILGGLALALVLLIGWKKVREYWWLAGFYLFGPGIPFVGAAVVGGVLGWLVGWLVTHQWNSFHWPYIGGGAVFFLLLIIFYIWRRGAEQRN